MSLWFEIIVVALLIILIIIVATIRDQLIDFIKEIRDELERERLTINDTRF